MSTQALGPRSHAVLMDRVYRRQRYIYDFTRKYYLFGRDLLIRELALSSGESLVEIGCGTARNLIRIANAYPGSRLFGLDASNEMLSTARHNVARAGLADRIQLVHGYAEALTPAVFGLSQPFDRAVFSYSLSMIPDWRQALTAATAALAEGGSLHVVDFGDLSGLGPVAARGLRAWLRLFHVEPRTEILYELENLAKQKQSDSGQMRLLPARYAFLWTGSKGAAGNFGGLHVAGQSHAVRNSDGVVPATATLVDIPPQLPPQ